MFYVAVIGGISAILAFGFGVLTWILPRIAQPSLSVVGVHTAADDQSMWAISLLVENPADRATWLDSLVFAYTIDYVDPGGGPYSVEALLWGDYEAYREGDVITLSGTTELSSVPDDSNTESLAYPVEGRLVENAGGIEFELRITSLSISIAARETLDLVLLFPGQPTGTGHRKS